MKKVLFFMISALFAINMQAQDLIITGVFDGPLPGGKPKVLELYAINDVSDLSVYTVKNQTNANTEWGSDYNLTGSANAGDFIYITGVDHTADFNTYFGNSLTPFESGVVNVNGDDRLAIFNAADIIVDLFGEDGVDGTDSEWEYLDGWAYRNNNSAPNPSFNTAEWTFSGINANDDQTSNATASNPFPIGSYTQGGNLEFYELYIGGEQVSSENAGDLTVLPGISGTVNYNHATKTLTLDNATMETGAAIENFNISNLKIKLIGTNTMTASVFCLKNHVSTQIEGEGSLTANSSNTISIFMLAPLTIKNCSVEAVGTNWGIAGYDGQSGEELVIDHATVKATGAEAASIADIQSLTLNSCAITAPAGAAFDENLHGVALNGSLVNEQVLIEPNGSVVTDYALYIAGTQVNSENAADLSVIEGVDGTLTYDDANKTLSLEDATINAANEYAVYNTGIDGLKIVITGTNSIESEIASLISTQATEINGTGTLTATSTTQPGIYMKAPLSITNCKVEAVGEWGIAGNEAAAGEDLTINNATLKATGTAYGSIADIASLTLNNCAITAPAGAAFDTDLNGVALNGNILTEQVVIEPTVGIQNPDNMAAFSIYPNPASDYISISTNTLNTDKQSVLLYDLSGKLVLSRSITDKTIQMNIKHLKNGVYVIKIGENVKRFVKK